MVPKEHEVTRYRENPITGILAVIILVIVLIWGQAAFG